MNLEELLTFRLSREIDKEIMERIMSEADMETYKIEQFKERFDKETENKVDRMLLGSERDIHPL